jgi:mannonate dehydratase
MRRRDFLSAAASAVAAAAVPSPISASQPAKKATAKPSQIKLGHEYRRLEDDQLKELVRYSVTNVGGPPVIADPTRIYATVEELESARDICSRNGLSYDLVTPPILASSHIDREKHPAIMLAQSPERDRDIDAFNTYIKNCAAAGVPAIKYNMSILGVLRNSRTPGRGDASYNTWNLAEAHPDPPLTRAGHVDADMFWERITYFLDRTVPVANEYKVRMACHPQDPGVPPEGYQGVDRVLGTVDGLKKFISIRESPYHGLNFCQGTVSEMLQDPGKEIYDVIRYFGSRNKIFNVHFRNIRGHRDSFMEVFPDEGSVDFVKAIQVYKEVGYSGALMPDHPVPSPNDPGGEKSFTFCFGYIRALIQAVNETPRLGEA